MLFFNYLDSMTLRTLGKDTWENVFVQIHAEENHHMGMWCCQWATVHLQFKSMNGSKIFTVNLEVLSCWPSKLANKNICSFCWHLLLKQKEEGPTFYALARNILNSVCLIVPHFLIQSRQHCSPLQVFLLLCCWTWRQGCPAPSVSATCVTLCTGRLSMHTAVYDKASTWPRTPTT